MRSLGFSSKLEAILGLALLFSADACQPAPLSNSNANANAPAANSRTISTKANSESANNGAGINAREPEKYSATFQMSIETESGEKAAGIPSLSVKVARNLNDRRAEFTLPDGTPLIYLDHNNHHYVILPARKQYAELAQETVDASAQRLMMPGQLIEDLKDLNGVERVGEGMMNGRAAEKYRYTAPKDPKAKTGEVKPEAFVYLDKETGLPLRAELLPQSSGDGKSGKATRAVTEIRDFKTEIEPSLFEVPAGFALVAAEKLRPQIDELTNAVANILRAMMARRATVSAPSP